MRHSLFRSSDLHCKTTDCIVIQFSFSLNTLSCNTINCIMNVPSSEVRPCIAIQTTIPRYKFCSFVHKLSHGTPCLYYGLLQYTPTVTLLRYRSSLVIQSPVLHFTILAAFLGLFISFSIKIPTKPKLGKYSIIMHTNQSITFKMC